MEKICCFCKHWTCNHSAGYNYSEYTWSSGSFDLSCDKGHYSEDDDMTTEHFRTLILKATNCADFEVVTFETPNCEFTGRR
ncbi:MAG TPA: hypothetical protein VFH31_05360 [Pyrinomonadaceae bacterium]|nr:hypothetical protein [Pyrinomonadaceae bacterium]